MEEKYKKIWEEAEETFLEVLRLSLQNKRIPENRRCCRRRTSGKRSHFQV